MTTTKIVSPTQGFMGELHEIEFKTPDSVLIFQLPRKTSMLNEDYIKAALKAVKSSIPEGRQAIVIGADVNIYEIAGEDAVMLKLKGILF